MGSIPKRVEPKAKLPDIQKILVCVRDPQARSTAAVRKAAALAAACGAELELFHDIDSPVYIETVASRPDSVPAFRRQISKAVLKKLDRMAAPLRARGLNVSVAAEWDFPPSEAIVRRARKEGASLIVVQQHRRHRMAGLLGYTDWALLRESPIPVLLVKSGRAYAQPAILAAIDPQHAYGKVGSLDSRVLTQALSLAGALGGVCHVMHAYQPLALPILDAGTDYAPMATEIESRARSAAEVAFRSALEAGTVPAACRHLVQANPAVAIPALARKLRSSIVVMGAVSRRGLERLFIGNTAERVIDELKCDLLVVKPAGFTGRISRTRRGMRVASMVS
jgi:universal stress protein E